ncbi:MAG: winged helix-turn-helix transcriptional regulator [Rhodospirillales bacterium]|nr:winged helix-turn-helix transcriptional regulator [Rhodospirillales bacterium]MBT4040318.1 winged helix-turn-helix transcriptional regulator [Rhodospirillales bacterium]MBT4625045.1 winged helix-turn-helix transcriptional regulator [Rhodospirillales bacterium]MBT5353174.1 winged helix-turn-helix transcriptional regulator [Rhodospirillales bacterium]MBT6825630.1 winged helix-turn-helix transcriptional regulator [Rhodospirillales bacterium]
MSAQNDVSPEEMVNNAKEASGFLKGLANENRLMILCSLAEGEKNVSELEAMLNVRQPTLSQQLARLRSDNLVSTRRDAKAIYYSLASEEARQIIRLMFQLFCSKTEAAE